MKKRERQQLIEQILKEEKLSKQEDFVKALAERGQAVTQATISRDIQEMQLVKIPDEDGGYHYHMPVDNSQSLRDRLERTVKHSFVAIDVMDKLVHIRTIPGSGRALGTSFEAMDLDEVFCVFGGDDQILIICRSDQGALDIKNRIIELV